MITKPAMPIGVICATAPVISTTTPTTKHAPAAIARRRAEQAERRTSQRRGELGVFLDECALHLLEQSELLFREWHRSSLEGRPDDGMSCDQA